MKTLRTLIATETALCLDFAAIRDCQDTGNFRGPAFSQVRASFRERLDRIALQIAQHPVRLVAAERAHQQAESLRIEAERLLSKLPPVSSPLPVDLLRADLDALQTSHDAALSPHLRRLRRYAGDERELNADIRAHALTRIAYLNLDYLPRVAAAHQALTEAQHAEREQHFADVARSRAAELQTQADALQAAHPNRPTRARGADRGPRRDAATRPALLPDLHKRFEYVPATGELLRLYRADALVTGTHVQVRGVWYPVLEIIAALIGTNDRLTLRDVREPPALSNLLRSPKP